MDNPEQTGARYTADELREIETPLLRKMNKRVQGQLDVKLTVRQTIREIVRKYLEMCANDYIREKYLREVLLAFRLPGELKHLECWKKFIEQHLQQIEAQERFYGTEDNLDTALSGTLGGSAVTTLVRQLKAVRGQITYRIDSLETDNARRPYAQKMLIADMLFLWESATGSLGTDVNKGKTGGPLIAFMTAALTPVLKSTKEPLPTADALRGYIRHYTAKGRPPSPLSMSIAARGERQIGEVVCDLLKSVKVQAERRRKRQIRSMANHKRIAAHHSPF